MWSVVAKQLTPLHSVGCLATKQAQLQMSQVALIKMAYVCMRIECYLITLALYGMIVLLQTNCQLSLHWLLDLESFQEHIPAYRYCLNQRGTNNMYSP